jgi:5-deoxy-glucuronate isomerase
LIRSGEAARDGFSVCIDVAAAGWQYTGLRILDLHAGDAVRLHTGDSETIVLPLRGSCEVHGDDAAFSLAGRPDVFSGVTDFAYLPRDAEVEIRTSTGGRFALPSAKADRRMAPRHVRARDVPVELRGPGRPVARSTTSARRRRSRPTG